MLIMFVSWGTCLFLVLPSYLLELLLGAGRHAVGVLHLRLELGRLLVLRFLK